MWRQALGECQLIRLRNAVIRKKCDETLLFVGAVWAPQETMHMTNIAYVVDFRVEEQLPISVRQR
jgi:hypothetical protein